MDIDFTKDILSRKFNAKNIRRLEKIHLRNWLPFSIFGGMISLLLTLTFIFALDYNTIENILKNLSFSVILLGFIILISTKVHNFWQIDPKNKTISFFLILSAEILFLLFLTFFLTITVLVLGVISLAGAGFSG